MSDQKLLDLPEFKKIKRAELRQLPEEYRYDDEDTLSHYEALDVDTERLNAREVEDVLGIGNIVRKRDTSYSLGVRVPRNS